MSLQGLTPGPDGETPPGPFKDRWVWAAGMLLALHAVLAWLLRDPGILTAQDDAHHLILAEALRDFQYRDLFRADAPVHSRYPPVYSAILALWEPLMGGRFDGIVALNIGFTTAALGLLYTAVHRLWGPVLAIAVLAPLSVSLHLLEIAGQVRSEAAYLFFTMVALVSLSHPRVRKGGLIIAGTATIFAALTRSIGIALVGAVAVLWVLERRKVAAPAFIGISAAAVGGWLLTTFRAPEQVVGRSYAADLTLGVHSGEGPGLVGVLLARVLQNAPDLAYPWLGYHLGVPNLRGTTVDNLIVAVILVAALGIGILILLHRWRVAALYLGAYVAILLVWPWIPGRFLVPVVPLLLLVILLGLATAAEALWERAALLLATAGRSGRRGPAFRSLGVGGAVVVFFALGTTAWGSARTAVRVADRMGCERGSHPPHASCVQVDQASFFDALEYIQAELSRDAVFLTTKSEPLYYYTRRLTAPIDAALAQSSESFLPFLREYGAGFIILGSLQQADANRLPDLLEPNCRQLAVGAVFPPRTYLLRIRDLEEPPGEDGCEAVRASRLANVDRDFARDP